MTEQELLELSSAMHLALSTDEMRAIQAHFRELGRDSTEIELETIAQTWSEHCSHKTLKGRVDCGDRVYDNLLAETIFAATEQIRAGLGPDDWCVSVFDDNAGIVKFDDRYHLCFKVETHNRPSAIDPYRGAATGLGGVIRDVLGCGLGGKPIANTDVFCVGPLDLAPDKLPPGVIHPDDILRGVVEGVSDYGNHCGIPTVSGAVTFDNRYVANPLVFCGTVGLIPVNRVEKSVRGGDRIVVIGGRTGRDGIHGATFSSAGLGENSDKLAKDAIQSGCPFTGKKLVDVVLRARDRNLFRSITDCGAGGFSSAVGEMCAGLGATVELERVPLKDEELSPTEIWISESQERMILAVPPENWAELQQLCVLEGVVAAEIGVFESTGILQLRFRGETVGQLSLSFLHDGRPKVSKIATFASIQSETTTTSNALTDVLKEMLASPNVRSREAIIRQYDHEVQGAMVLRPLVGKRNDGPGDAAVLAPIPGSHRGVAIACGINPQCGAIDPYDMAAAAIDEAVRNVVAVGADPSRIALLDNFAWGNIDDPESLGALVRACEACRDVAIAWNMPFISGKDSLNNEFHRDGWHSSIPGTLLISAIGIVSDVRKCVSMDLKKPGNRLVLIGETTSKLARVNTARALGLFQALHAAISRGLIRSCHDLSKGGLAVAAAEMAFAGGVGADLRLRPDLPDVVQLFSESPTRWLVEVPAEDFAAFTVLFAGLPIHELGETVPADRFRVAGQSGEWIIWAKLNELMEVWQRPLI